MEEKEKILEEIEKLKKRIEELNASFIDFELPKNYDKMTKEEQQAYHKKQEKLKKQALENMNNYSVVSKNYTIVSYPKNKTVAFLRMLFCFRFSLQTLNKQNRLQLSVFYFN